MVSGFRVELDLQQKYTGAKDLAAAGAARREHMFVTRGAVESVVFVGKRFLYETFAAIRAVEALVMPMDIFE